MSKPFIRPRVLHGMTVRVAYGAASIYVVLNADDEGALREVFVFTKPVNSADCEAIGRLISTGLKYGVPAEKLAAQLKGIGGPGGASFADGHADRSIPDVIGRVIGDWLKAKEDEE